MMKLRKTKDLLDALAKGTISHNFGFTFTVSVFPDKCVYSEASKYGSNRKCSHKLNTKILLFLRMSSNDDQKKINRREQLPP